MVIHTPYLHLLTKREFAFLFGLLL